MVDKAAQDAHTFSAMWTSAGQFTSQSLQSRQEKTVSVSASEPAPPFQAAHRGRASGAAVDAHRADGACRRRSSCRRRPRTRRPRTLVGQVWIQQRRHDPCLSTADSGSNPSSVDLLDLHDRPYLRMPMTQNITSCAGWPIASAISGIVIGPFCQSPQDRRPHQRFFSNDLPHIALAAVVIDRLRSSAVDHGADLGIGITLQVDGAVRADRHTGAAALAHGASIIADRLPAEPVLPTAPYGQAS